MFVRPRTMQPAARSRATTVASRCAGGRDCKTTDPAVVTLPATSNRSLTETGRPARGGSAAPAARSRSTASACARATISRAKRRPACRSSQSSISVRMPRRWYAGDRVLGYPSSGHRLSIVGFQAIRSEFEDPLQRDLGEAVAVRHAARRRLRGAIEGIDLRRVVPAFEAQLEAAHGRKAERHRALPEMLAVGRTGGEAVLVIEVFDASGYAPLRVESVVRIARHAVPRRGRAACA